MIHTNCWLCLCMIDIWDWWAHDGEQSAGTDVKFYYDDNHGQTWGLDPIHGYSKTMCGQPGISPTMARLESYATYIVSQAHTPSWPYMRPGSYTWILTDHVWSARHIPHYGQAWILCYIHSQAHTPSWPDMRPGSSSRIGQFCLLTDEFLKAWVHTTFIT